MNRRLASFMRLSVLAGAEQGHDLPPDGGVLHAERDVHVHQVAGVLGARDRAAWSTVGPRKPNSIDVSVAAAFGSAAGDDDWVTVNSASPGFPFPVMFRATQLPGVRTVCVVPGAGASARQRSVRR